MPGQKFGSRKPYISIVQGTLKQKVEQDHPEAEKRDYELSDGRKGTKYEISYKSWAGIVEDLRIKDGEYGEMLEIEFEDAILSINTESRYFSDFVKKLASADINQFMEIAPYDFEVDGKRRVGMSIYQGKDASGKRIKLPNYYWNETDNVACNGIPQPSGDTKKFKKKDWQKFYLDVTIFLTEEVSKIKEKISAPTKISREDIDEMAEADNSPIKEEEIIETEKDEDEVRIEDVPF